MSYRDLLDDYEAHGDLLDGYEVKPHATAIVCADGFRLSVQASDTHYSCPRENYPGVPYTQVEVGYPSADPGDELGEYQESPGHNDRTEDVYPYVPIEIVEALIESHGGIKEGNLPVYKK